MTEKESFAEIDLAIRSFLQSEGLSKNIKVSRKPHSDWLVYNWRQLAWKNGDVHCSIEVHPSFDDQQNVTAWNLSYIASYDKDLKRHYLKKPFVENVGIDHIAQNAKTLILESYKYLNATGEDEIPFAVDLSNDPVQDTTEV